MMAELFGLSLDVTQKASSIPHAYDGSAEELESLLERTVRHEPLQDRDLRPGIGIELVGRGQDHDLLRNEPARL